jgi:ParB family chromosome partitioning protein
VRFVEGRLRLASLAPVVFQALADGEITLDIAKAYASTPDRERQAHETQAADKIALLEDEASSDEDRAQAETELETIEKAVEAITDKPPVLDEALRPQVGAFLVLGPDGTPRLHQTLYIERTPQEHDELEDDGNEAGEPAPRAVGLSQRLRGSLER